MVIPPLFITLAANIKKGTANKVKLLIPLSIPWAISAKLKIIELSSSMYSTDTIPKVKTTGTPSNMKNSKPPTNISIANI